MIDDALKSIRRLYWLLITVSVVSLVFSFSINLPHEKIDQKAAIDKLLESNFLAYKQFVEANVQEFSHAEVQPIAVTMRDKLERELEDEFEPNSYYISNLDAISAEFATPVHVGRILIEHLVLANPSEATLNQLVKVFDLDKHARDVQVFIPRVSEVIPAIVAFFEDQADVSDRIRLMWMSTVSSIETSINSETYSKTNSFEPSDEIKWNFSFTLTNLSTNYEGRFSETFSADIETLPETSFLHWVQHESQFEDIVTVQDGKIRLPSVLAEVPETLREESLGNLSLRLNDEIKQLHPENRSVKLLDIKVPGTLIISVAPLTIIALAYYLMKYSRHLQGIAQVNPESIRHFAWLPLIFSQQWQIPIKRKGNRQLVISAWRLETALTVIGLPLLSLTVLYCKVASFDYVSLLHVTLILGAVLATALMGFMSIRHIAIVRQLLNKSN